MKILIISSTVFAIPLKAYGGLELVVWQQAKGLAAKGHEVTLVAPDGSECPGVKMIHTGPPGQHSEEQAYDKYWKAILEHQVVIDSSWQKHSLLLKAERPQQCPPCFCVMHAPVHTMLKSLPPNVEKPCIVCISDDQRSHFEALFGHPARRVYNAVDAGYYKANGMPRTDRFLFLARFSSIKGPDLAIELSEKCNVNLDMIGDTTITGEPQLYADCKAKEDGKRIKILGGCSRTETVFWYSQARALFHLNQRFREPFGLAPVEAQAAGLGVLAWDYGAMRETIKHGETGFLVKSMQEAEQIVRSGALDKIDRNACRENAKRFSEERMISDYETLCDDAIKHGGW